MEEWGAPGVGPAFEVTCADHGGSGMGIIQQWDAEAGQFVALTDYIESDSSVIDPLVEEDSMAYAAENGVEPGCN
jgi:branched-chain amino acid transport system substrate-binding protein